MHQLTKLTDAVTRSISPENFSGESGRGGMAMDGFGTKAARVIYQVLGWKPDRRYHPRTDDVASVAYWYQTLPSSKLASLPDRDALEMY